MSMDLRVIISVVSVAVALLCAAGMLKDTYSVLQKHGDSNVKRRVCNKRSL